MADVLVVDDDLLTRRLVAGLLRAEGHVVVTASDPSMALGLVTTGLRPDLAVLDVVMPGLTGFELAGLVRLRIPDLPIVFLTARRRETDIERGLALGAQYLTKPFDPEDLLLSVSMFAPSAATGNSPV